MWEIKSKDDEVRATTTPELEYHGEWMGQCYVTVSVESPTPVNFEIGDYIIYRGERFEINYDPGKIKIAPRQTEGDAFKYKDIKFNSLADELSRCDFLDIVPADNHLHYTSLPKVSFYGGVRDLADRIQANLDRVYPNQWTVEVSPEYSGTEKKNVSIDTEKVWDALSVLVNDFETYFTINGRTITIGEAGVPAGHLFKYGKGNGLYEIEQNAEADQAIVTRLRAYGSSRNLPHRYYNRVIPKKELRITAVDLDSTFYASPTYYDLFFTLDYFPFDSGQEFYGLVIDGVEYKAKIFKDGSVWISSNHNDSRPFPLSDKNDLIGKSAYYTGDLEVPGLPAGRDLTVSLPNNMAVNFLMLPGFPAATQDPYIDSSNIDTLGVREGTIFFDGSGGLEEIYPSIEGMTAEQLRAAGVACNSTGELDEIVTAEQITDDGVGKIEEGETQTKAETDTFKITVKDLGFDINEYLTAETATVAFKTGALGGREFEITKCEVIANAEKVSGYELELNRVYDDDLKLWFPYKNYNAAAGDKFVLLYIDMPNAYIDAASQKLLTAATEWLAKNDYSRSIYAPKIDEIFMARQHDEAMASGGSIASLHDTLKAGMLLLFEDEDLNIDASVFIDNLTIKEGKGIPTYEVTLKEEKTVGRLDKMQNQIDSLVAGKGQWGGYTAAQIKEIARALGEQLFLSRIKRDTAEKKITFLEGLSSGAYQKGVSGATIESGGYGEFESLLVRDSITTENLTVTKLAHFFELVIDRIKSAGGALLLTPANGFTVYSVDETTAGYKLRYLAKDGDRKLSNDWKAGDQAICQTFNAAAGTSYNVSNKYYWALVTAAGTETVNGDDYHYIVISATDKDGEVNPEPGDEIAMLGYRGDDDPERQSAIYISAYNSIDAGINAPLIAHYRGVNDFDLPSHRHTWIAANGNVFRGSLRVEDGTTIDEVLETKGKGYTSNLLGGTPNGAANWKTSCYVNSDSDDDTEAITVTPWSVNKPYMANGYTGVGLTVGGLGLAGCSLHFRSLGWPIIAGKTYTLSFILSSAYDTPELWVYIGRAAGWVDAVVPHKKLTIAKGTNRQIVQFTTTDAAATPGDYLYVTFNFSDSLKDYASGTGIEIGDLKLEEGVNDNPAWTPAATDLVGATGATGAAGKDGKDGADGDSPYTLWLDNPNSLMSFDAAGDIPNGAYPKCNAKVLYGNTDKTSEWTFAISGEKGGMFYISGSTVTLAEFSDLATSSASVTITASKSGEESLTAVMTVTKVKDGANGDEGPQGIQGVPGAASVMYALIPSASFIRKGFDGSVDPATLSCKVVKITGGVQELSGEHDLTAQILPDGAVMTWPHAGGEAAGLVITESATAVEIKLTHSDTNVTLAQSRVPVLSDAADIHQQWSELQTDYNGLKSEVGSLTESGQHITRLEQTAESISMKVSDTPFSRNMLGGTNQGKTGWSTRASSAAGSVTINPWAWENDNFTDKGPGIGITVGGKSLTAFNAVFKSTIDVDLKKDKAYLLSFVAGCAYQTDVMCYLSGPTATWAAMATDFKTQVLSAGYGRYTFALTAKADYSGELYVILAYRDRLTDWPDNAWLAIGDLQLESGTVPTAYSKAETDLRRLLLDTGIDIEAGKVTVTADKFVVNDNDGTPMSLIQLSEDGTPMIATGLLNVNSVEVYNGVFHKPDLDIAMSINRDGDKAYTIYQDSSKETVEDSDGTAYPKKVPQLVVKVAYVDEVTGKVLENTDNLKDAQQSVMQYYNRDGSMRWYLGPDGIVQLQLSTVTWTRIDVYTELSEDGVKPQSTREYPADYSFFRCNVPEGLRLEEEWEGKDGLAVETAEIDGLPVEAGTYYAAKPRRLYYIPKTTTSSGVTSAYWGWVWARTKYEVVAEGENSYVTSADIQWIENEAPEGGVIDR